MKPNFRSQMSRMICAVLIILSMSCGKDSVEFTPRVPTGDFASFFAEVSDPMQEYTVNASQESIVSTDKGSYIRIPKGILIDEAGNEVNESITLKIREIDEISEMIKYNVTTMTKNEYLISERMFLIHAFQNEKKLRIKEGMQYQILVPDFIPDSKMKLFYGTEREGTILWEEAEDGQQNGIINEWFFEIDSGVFSDFGYVLNCDRFEWVNIDKYLTDNPENLVSVCVNLPPELYTPENTILFMIIEGTNTTIAFNHDREGKFCEPYGMVPSGWNVKIISISAFDDGIFHYGSIEDSIIGPTSKTLIPKEMSLEEIEQKIEEL